MNQKRIAIIGAGGKSTSLAAIAAQYSSRRVLMTTTTHVAPRELESCRILLENPSEEALLEALKKPGIVGAGQITADGKIRGLSEDLLTKAAEAAEITVFEADGAKRLPLKLHNDTEPVIPAWTDTCLIVAGLSALGKPMETAVHRYARNPRWSGDRIVGPEEVLYCILEAAEKVNLPRQRLRVLLNQADCVPGDREIPWLLAALERENLCCKAGSLRENPHLLENWI